MQRTERELSYNVLNDVYNRGAFSNITLGKHLRDENDNRKQNFIREMVYGVLENDIYLEYVIGKSSKIKMSKIHKKILIILKMGIYQIMFMDSVPDSAAVNESVILTKKHGNKGSIGYVNGMLRNISRKKDEFRDVKIKEDSKRISIQYSHPKWLVDKWINEYGVEFTEELSRANNEKPSLNITINTLKTNKNDLKKKLEDRGFEIREGQYSVDTLIIDNPFQISKTKEFLDGEFTIQDESSALVAQIMNPVPGSIVIDVCGAPGGKSVHIAQKMGNRGKVISRDINEYKLQLIDENSKRLGTDIIKTEIYDARDLDDSLIGGADYVLVDAPCSGLGLIRRKPEIKINKTQSDIDSLSALQYKILENAKKYLKADGILVYSTCTISNSENRDIINKFLKENPEFSTVSLKENMINDKDISTLDEGYIELYPNIHGTDGFFIAKMRKQR